MLKRETSGRTLWPLALVLIALTFGAVAVIIFLRLESWPARTAHQSADELERLGKDLQSAFVDVAHLQPRVTINNRVYLEQTTSVTQLSIMSQRIEVEHELQNTWAASSKRVKLHGTFNVKAGFDLRHNFSIDLGTDEITVQLPHAEILGVEQEQVEVLALENGLWNRISAGDVQNELSALPQLAREKAIASNLPGQAEHALEQQLLARLHLPQPLHLIFTDASIATESPAAEK